MYILSLFCLLTFQQQMTGRILRLLQYTVGGSENRQLPGVIALKKAIIFNYHPFQVMSFAFSLAR